MSAKMYVLALETRNAYITGKSFVTTVNLLSSLALMQKYIANVCWNVLNIC